MPAIDIVLETPVSRSVRAAQVSSMFDVPPCGTQRMEWHGSLPIEDRPWHVGLIVGPSGAGKSTILRHHFGAPPAFSWGAASVIDDFDPRHGVEAVSAICGAVGFNTIPAWLRPFAVLSNGEQFRVDLARRLLEGGAMVICDEFTSVVDRQVAKIGAHAVQKYIRRAGRQFVAATCHADLEDWLQPDWVLEPATMNFRWRVVCPRPRLACAIARVGYEAWARYARFHYMSADLARAARCFELSVDGTPAAFAAALYRPHAQVRGIWGLSRGVVLPDWQGLGLIFALIDRLGACYRAKGLRLRSYPAHPGYIRAHDRSPVWRLDKPPGRVRSSRNATTTLSPGSVFGARPCAVFEYVGAAAKADEAAILLD